MTVITEPARQTPVFHNPDVLVVVSVGEGFGTGGVILVWRAPALLVDVMLLGADGSSGGFGWSLL